MAGLGQSSAMLLYSVTLAEGGKAMIKIQVSIEIDVESLPNDLLIECEDAINPGLDDCEDAIRQTLKDVGITAGVQAVFE